MKRVFAAVLLTAALVNEAGWVRAAHASDDVSRLIQQLHDPDVQHRRDAARELSKITPLPPDGIEVRTFEQIENPLHCEIVIERERSCGLEISDWRDE